MRMDVAVAPGYVAVLRNGEIGGGHEKYRLFLYREADRSWSDDFRKSDFELAYSEVWLPVNDERATGERALTILADLWFEWLKVSGVLDHDRFGSSSGASS